MVPDLASAMLTEIMFLKSQHVTTENIMVLKNSRVMQELHIELLNMGKQEHKSCVDSSNMHKHVTQQSHVCRCIKLGEKVSGAADTGGFTVGLCSYATNSTFNTMLKHLQ